MVVAWAAVEACAHAHWQLWLATLVVAAVAYHVAPAAAGGVERHEVVVLARPDPLIVLQRRDTALRVCGWVGPVLVPAVFISHARKVYLAYGSVALALSQPLSRGSGSAESAESAWRVHAGKWGNSRRPLRAVALAPSANQ